MRVRGVHRLRRWAHRSANSWPRLSGDAFALLADVHVRDSLTTMDHGALQSLRAAQVIFAQADHAEELLSESRRLAAKILILGNSDRDAHAEFAVTPPHLRVLLMQNSYISDNRRIFTLPIGIENAALSMNGRSSLFRDSAVHSRRDAVLVGPFSPTHPVRRHICVEFGGTPGPWVVHNARLSPKQLAEQMWRFTWVLAPRGNGTDTHRVWEGLYRGALPIVERSPWSQSLEYFNFPLLLAESLRPTFVREAIFGERRPVSPQGIPYLWMGRWHSWLKSVLASEGPRNWA
jgi:hypothetical protein